MRKKVPDVGVCALLLLSKRTVIRAVGAGRVREKRAISPLDLKGIEAKSSIGVLSEIYTRNQLLNDYKDFMKLLSPPGFADLPAPLVKRCSRIVSTLTDAQESTLATPQSIL